MASWNSAYIDMAALATALLLTAFPLRADNGPSFDELLTDLEDEQWSVREEATRELVDRITKTPPKISQEDIERLRKTIVDGDSAELRYRATLVFGEFVLTQPSSKAALDNISMQFKTTVIPPLGKVREFTFDGFSSTSDPTPASGEAANRVEKVKDALRRGDTDAAREQLVDLQNYLDGLPTTNKGTVGDPFITIDDFELQDEDGDLIRKDKILELIQDSIDRIPAIEQEIRGAAGDIDPAAPNRAEVIAPGDLDTGITLQVAVENVVTPGGIVLTAAGPDLSLVDAPDGFDIIGRVFSIVADDGLQVLGEVEIGLQFGDVQLFGPTVRDPGELLLARFSDLGLDLLAIDDIDLTDGTLFGSYRTTADERDQFGTLLVLQRVPVPPVACLLALGLGVLVATGRRSRPQMPTAIYYEA